MSHRASILAGRFELGGLRLAAFARTLSEAEWAIRVPLVGRRLGLIVHAVATRLPVEIELARAVAEGRDATGLSEALLRELGQVHDWLHAGVARRDTLALLGRNTLAAAAAIRVLTDAELDRAGPISLYGGVVASCHWLLARRVARLAPDHLGWLTRVVGRPEGPARVRVA